MTWSVENWEKLGQFFAEDRRFSAARPAAYRVSIRGPQVREKTDDYIDRVSGSLEEKKETKGGGWGSEDRIKRGRREEG